MEMTEIVLLDGGMGQELTRRSSQPAHPQWAAHVLREEPEIVEGLQTDYIKAGARLITLNSYSTTRSRFEVFNTQDQFEWLQNRAIEVAKRARDAAGVDAAIAGCLPPLVGSYKPETTPPDGAALAEYRELAQIQADHVDVFLCETMSNIREAKAAATAACETGKPVWVALTLADDSTRLRSGETVSEAAAALAHLPIQALLANCCPPEMITASMGEFAETNLPTGGYANGFTSIADGFVLGETVDMLGTRTDLDPDAYAEHAMTWVAAGARIIGGCCETGPGHIARMAERLTEAGHTITGTLQ
jgi:S-methylmethionine-dependent homocysteine/selenocysteine methylase